MARCEDFPACGHELGCCPDFDPDTGEQLNMVCVCGAKLPIDAKYSICEGCMRDPDDPNAFTDEELEQLSDPSLDPMIDD